ncbi:MAG: hypothetical protein AAGK04_07745 [Planctomycetota bacterium]
MSGLAGITNSGALPTLELSMRFAAQRQRLLAHNIANLTTPEFQPMDADPRDFQRALADAVQRRRDETGGQRGPLPWREEGPLRRDARGDLRIDPDSPKHAVLRHDRNSSDLERSMQALAENAAFFRLSSDLMRFESDRLVRAMRETV